VDNISAIARQGLDQAQVQLESAATKPAEAETSLHASSPRRADFSEGIVDLMSAKHNFAINISVMKTADEMQK
jgi:flagellar basal body rod protein FlgC